MPGNPGEEVLASYVCETWSAFPRGLTQPTTVEAKSMVRICYYHQQVDHILAFVQNE